MVDLYYRICPKQFRQQQKHVSVQLRAHKIAQVHYKLFNSTLSNSLFIWVKQDWVEINFQIEVPNLIQQITEDRLRHARGPVQTASPLHINPLRLSLAHFVSTDQNEI